MTSDSIEEFEAYFRRDIELGRGVPSGRMEYLSLEDLKETSVHIVGAAGFGKSYYLRHLIDQLVNHRQPFGVLDPHTEVFEYAVWRLRQAGVGPERIVLVDPSDQQHAIGFNPLACGLADAGETASMVLDAFLKAWGAKSFDETPRLEGVLRGTFRLLIENGLTLLEAFDVLNVDNARLRKALRERVSDRYVRQDFEQHERLDKAEKLALFESSRNRIRRIISARPLQMMLSQTKNPINFKDVLDDGKYLLANVGGVSGPEIQRLLGALLLNGIFHAAKLRNSRQRCDWFLICDEFGEFATRDVANSLDQLRKFGVHFILAHQRLAQLAREDLDVLSAVMTNAKIKIVFGGLERVEAERVAREVFTGVARGNRVKHISHQTKFRPVNDVFITETDSWSDGETDSESTGRSTSKTSNDSDDDDSTSSTSAESGSRGRGSSRSQSHSRSQVPITGHEEFEEETSRQFWSLEEEWERLIGRVHGLPKRHALVKVYNRPVLHIKTPHVDVEQDDGRLDRFMTAVMVRSPYARPVEVVAREIEDRRERVAQLGKPESTKGPESFRE